MSKVYVGNLSWSTSDDTLRQVFGAYGNILDSIVMRDRETARSRGFGFVTYGTEAEAQIAIQTMNEQELDGRRLKVNLANARTGGGSNPSAGNQQQGGYAIVGYGGYGGFQQQQPGYGTQPGYGGYQANPIYGQPMGGQQQYPQTGGFGGGSY